VILFNFFYGVIARSRIRSQEPEPVNIGPAPQHCCHTNTDPKHSKTGNRGPVWIHSHYMYLGESPRCVENVFSRTPPWSSGRHRAPGDLLCRQSSVPISSHLYCMPSKEIIINIFELGCDNVNLIWDLIFLQEQKNKKKREHSFDKRTKKGKRNMKPFKS